MKFILKLKIKITYRVSSKPLGRIHLKGLRGKLSNRHVRVRFSVLFLITFLPSFTFKNGPSFHLLYKIITKIF